MNDPTVLVLLALADGPQHGYAIQQLILERADVRLGPGTLYGAIGRLEDAGLIAGTGATGRRRPYRLTAAGRRELASRAEALRRVARWAAMAVPQ